MKKKLIIIFTLLGLIAIIIGIIILTTKEAESPKKEEKKELTEIETYEQMMEQLYYKEGTTIKYKETLDDGTYLFERYKDGKIIESYSVSKDWKTVINSQSDGEIIGGTN